MLGKSHLLFRSRKAFLLVPPRGHVDFGEQRKKGNSLALLFLFRS